MTATRVPPKNVVDLLALDEDTILHAYTDSLGFLTIGTGRLIDARKGGGITLDESKYLLANDVMRVRASLTSTYPWFTSLDLVRAGVVISLRFQLGAAGFASFTRFIADMAAGNYPGAASELQASVLSSQVPERVARNCQMLITGQWV